MSIASAITAAQGRVADCYTAISNKGGTLPATQNLANMPTAIGSITTGGTIDSLTVTPTTSQQTITATGGVDGYSPITVNAVTSSIDANISAGNIKKDVTILGVTGTYEGGGGGVGIPREVSSGGVYQVPTSSFTFSLPSNATDLGNYSLYYAFNNCTGITSADLSSLTSVSGSSSMYYCFQGCTNLTSVDLSNLTTISGSSSFLRAFAGCTNLTYVNISSLTTISSSSVFQYAFLGSAIPEITFTSLNSINASSIFSYCFGKNNNIVIYFPALTTSSFGSYTNQFSSMLMQSTMINTSNAKIHFPSNLQSKVSSLIGYPNFGGSNTTIIFDLPATS